jgi:transposase
MDAKPRKPYPSDLSDAQWALLEPLLPPQRWVVERTFSWLSNDRRLSKHYEYWNETGEAMIHPAMIHLMLRRLTKKKPDVGFA